MPELPEAEANRENLTSWLAGERLLDVAVPDPLTRRGQRESDIRAAAKGQVVSAVRRRGKFLRLECSGDGPALLSHLGMSGKWALRQSGQADPPAVRAALGIAGGLRVVFSDKRRFGHFSVCLPADEERLARLGPEPLGPEFTGKRLAALLRATRRPVKSLLMDQDRIAGIGNIQAAEALWRAGIHPARQSDEVGYREAAKLQRAIRWTLRRSIRSTRTPEILYLSDGEAGRQSTSARFFVYGREGAACPRCRRGVIGRIPIGGRSSFFCPRCQVQQPVAKAPRTAQVRNASEIERRRHVQGAQTPGC